MYAGAPIGLFAALFGMPAVRRAGTTARSRLAWAAAPTLVSVVLEMSGVPVAPGIRAALGAMLSATVAWLLATAFLHGDAAAVG
jgi:hypothetical protein